MQPVTIKRSNEYERDLAVESLVKRGFEMIGNGKFITEYKGKRQYTTYWARLNKIKDVENG